MYDIITVCYCYLLQVGTNGYISFRRPVSSGFPVQFPESEEDFLVAPFWVHNDIRLAGSVSYEVYNWNTQQLQAMTEFIDDEVFSFPSLNTFTGAWMLLVEWDAVHPFPHGDPGNFPRNSTTNMVQNDYRSRLHG